MDTGVISDPKAILDEVNSRISEVILGKQIPIREHKHLLVSQRCKPGIKQPKTPGENAFPMESPSRAGVWRARSQDGIAG